MMEINLNDRSVEDLVFIVLEKMTEKQCKVCGLSLRLDEFFDEPEFDSTKLRIVFSLEEA